MYSEKLNLWLNICHITVDVLREVNSWVNIYHITVDVLRETKFVAKHTPHHSRCTSSARDHRGAKLKVWSEVLCVSKGTQDFTFRNKKIKRAHLD